MLFLANFFIQREFVFRHKDAQTATDWGGYYESTPFTARITRRYTAAVLASALKRFAGSRIQSIVELGGGNSCFFDTICRQFDLQVYHVVDSNARGLELLRQRAGGDPRLRLHRHDVTQPGLDLLADAAFSAGLIEHFDREGTRKAVEAHLRAVRPGGYAIISAPTPTWLYRAARNICELVGIWRFPDERPLAADEIRASVSGQGEIVFEKILWPLVFTQLMVVVRKRVPGQVFSTA